MYNTEINFIIDCSEEQYTKFLKKKYGYKSKIANCAGRYDCFDKIIKKEKYKCHYIWIGKFEMTTTGHCILVHELVHASFSILNIAGIEHKDATDEVFAYHMSFLLETAMIKIIRLKKNVQGRRKTRTNKRS